MQCGQCGRELTAAAIALGYCPQCGTHLEPESTSPGHSGASQALNDAGSPPAIQSGSHPEPVPHSPVPIAPPPAAITTYRNTGAVPAILIVMLVVILAIGAALVVRPDWRTELLASGNIPGTHKTPVASATATATATPLPPTPTPLPAVPPPPVGYKTFTSADGVFGWNVPTAWTPSTSSNGGATSANFVSPDQLEFVQVTSTSSTIDPASIAAYLQTFATSSNGTNFQVTEPANQTDINQTTWERAQATYMLNNEPQQVVGFAANHAGHGYILLYTAPSGSFQAGAGSTFQTMVNSFTFLHG